jgi:hypothetical protein
MRKILSIIFSLFFIAAQMHADVPALSAAGDSKWLPPESALPSILDKIAAKEREAGYEDLKDTNVPTETGVAHYQAVTQSLSSSSNIVPARAAYMEIMREIAYFSVYRGKKLATDEMIEGAASLAKTDGEKALAHFLAAWSLSESPLAQQRARAGAEFAQAEKLQPAALRDRMLVRYAVWAERDGFSTIAGDGVISTESDYEKALQLYDLVAKTASDSELAAFAAKRAAAIRAPHLDADIPYAFRSGSQVQFTVNSSNCPQVDISVYRIDLSGMNATFADASLESVAQAMTVPDVTQPVRRLSLKNTPEHPYSTVSSEVRLDNLLMPGAYLVSTTSGDLQSKSLLLVTDMALVLKVSRRQILAFTCNATTGKPVPEAYVTILTRQSGANGQWYRAARKSDADGVAFFEASELGNATDVATSDIVAFSASDEQETMAFLKSSAKIVADDPWTAVSIPDSPVYAAGSKVTVRSIARKREGGQFIIPAKSAVILRIAGPDGYVFHPDEFTSSVGASGIATISFTLPQNAPAGSYKITLQSASTKNAIGDPSEFTVAVQDAPDADVEILLSRREDDAGYEVGETIRGYLKVLSRSGTPEDLRDVSLLVEQRFYDFSDGKVGAWKEFSKTKLRTDSKGEAPFSVETSASLQNDYEYRITASMKDRDGRVSKTCRNFFVTRQDMYARISIGKSLYEENQPVELRLETVSAEGVPKAAKGTLRLFREAWQETWIDRRGHEISGDEMQTLRRKGSGWFSFGQSAGDYTLKSQGYSTETIAETDLSTDVTGRASYKLAAMTPGYYRLVWVSDGRRGTIVSNETPFWVSARNTDISSYRPDNIQIIVNPPSMEVDESSGALVSVPSPDQSVLLVYGSDTIDTWSVMAMKGTTHLAVVSHAGAGFDSFVEATCVNDEKAGTASARLRTGAPRYLTVAIESDDTSYLPGAGATFKITVSDASGKAVSGAHVCFWLSGGDLSDAGFPLSNLFSSEKTSLNLKSAFSTESIPFFQPSKPVSQIPVVQKNVEESDGTSDDDKDSSFYTGKAPAPSFGAANLVTGADGTAVAHVPCMPSMKAVWWATSLVSCEDGAAGFASKKITTSEALSTEVSFAKDVIEDEVFEIRATMVNNDESDATVECTIESEGLAPINPHMDPKLVEMPPGGTSVLSWSASYPTQGETQIVFTAKYEGQSLQMRNPLTVKAAPWRKTTTSATLLEGDGTFLIPYSDADTSRAETFCRISASPSRVAFAALPYLLEDPSVGSSEAAARLATVCRLRSMFESMHYGEVMIDEAMQGEGFADYFSQRIDADMDIVRANQAKDGAWGWTIKTKGNSFVTAWNLIMLDFCDGGIREKLSAALDAARDYAASAIVSEGQLPDIQAMLLLGIASRDAKKTRPSRLEAKALVNLTRIQERLGTFALGCLAISAKKYGFDDEARKIVLLIKAKATSRGEGRLSEIGWAASPSGGNVSASDVENTAMAALAIMTVNGTKDEYVDSSLRYICNRSSEGRWDGPRETALCIMALREFAAETSETDVRASCELLLNGSKAGGYDSSVEKPLAMPARILLADVSPKNNRLEIRRIAGTSPLFVSVETTRKGIAGGAFSKIADFTLTRKFTRTVQIPTLLEGFNEEVVALDPETPIFCGERIGETILVETRKTVPMLIVSLPRPSFSKWHAQASPAEIVDADGGNIAPLNVVQTYLSDALYISIENLPAGRWEIRVSHPIDYSGEFTIPAAAAWIPQRPSLRAESDSVKLKSVHR